MKIKNVSKAVLCLGLMVSFLAGCDPHENPRSEAVGKLESVRLGYDVCWNNYVLVRIGSHDYITANCASGVSIVHAESCPCRNGGVK